MKTSEVLRAAKAVIEDPRRWCRETHHDGAGAHCAVGAVSVVTGAQAYSKGNWPSVVALDHAASEVGSFSIECLNDDDGSHADVMAAFDRAIAAEEARETPATFPSEWARIEVPA